MFDDLDVLRSSPELQQLLSHYIQSTPEDQEAWLDRLMELEGVEPQDLVKLHGKLIAFSWLEQNSGNTPVLQPGAVPCCYRATSAGRRALQLAQRPPSEDEEEGFTPVPDDMEPKKRKEARFPKRRDRRRDKKEAEATTATSDPSQVEEAACLSVTTPTSEEAPTPCLTGDAA